MPASLMVPNFMLCLAHPEPGVQTTIAVGLGANLSMPRGTILGEYRARKSIYGPYDALATDGREVARLVLRYTCATDANGGITLASLVSEEGPLFDRKFACVDAYQTGDFFTQDLVGLDAQAATQLGRMIQGIVSSGILRVS